MAPKLSENEVLKLVQLYREQECLWDNRCEDYRNKEKRITALQTIRLGMSIEGLDVNEIKAKIKTIRSTYYLELNKIEKSTRSGAGNVYKPRAKWFEELDAFIKNVSKKRTTTDNIETDNTNDNSEQGTSSDIAQPDSPQSGTPAFTPRIRSKRSKLSQMSVMIKDLKNMQDTPRKVDEESDFYYFGRSVSSQLKKLSEEQAVIAQERIQSILTNCRLADIRAKQSYYHNPQLTQSVLTQYSQSNSTPFVGSTQYNRSSYLPPRPPPPTTPLPPPPPQTTPAAPYSPSVCSSTTSSSSLGFRVNDNSNTLSPLYDNGSDDDSQNAIHFSFDNA